MLRELTYRQAHYEFSCVLCVPSPIRSTYSDARIALTMLPVAPGMVPQKEGTTEDDTSEPPTFPLAYGATVLFDVDAPELPSAIHNLAAKEVNLSVQRDSNVPSSATPTLSFLGVPREIRDEVYRHLLGGGHGPEITCDPQTKTASTSTLLRVNRQVAAEVSDVLRIMNLWITLAFQTEVIDSRTEALLDAILSNTTLSCIKLCPAELDILRAGAILSFTISLNDQMFLDRGYRPRKVARGDRLSTSIAIFAYSRNTYDCFCRELRKFSRSFKTVHIQVNPRTKVPPHRIKGDFLIPLCRPWRTRKLSFHFSLSAANCTRQ